MGFFSDLKQDLAQAVNELTEDTAEKELLEEEERLKEELSMMEEEFQVNGVDKLESEYEEELEHYLVEEAIYATQEEADEYLTDVAALEKSFVDGFDQKLLMDEISEDVDADALNSLVAEYEKVVENDMEVIQKFEPEDVVEVQEEMEEVEELEEIEEIEMLQEEKIDVSEVVEESYVSMTDEKAEVGIIPAGMIVAGDISTTGALDLKGNVLGNIEIGGKLNISGSIQGNVKAVEVFAQVAKITGNIECDNSVKVGPNSVVIGNINARCAVIAGAVKGDIDVRGSVILDSSAIIMGNIKSKSVQINNGATIEGMCSQCYADVNPSSFFEGLSE